VFFVNSALKIQCLVVKNTPTGHSVYQRLTTHLFPFLCYKGYGDRVPVTTGGRWFTIIYALLGIPFTGVILAKIGIHLTELIKKLDDTISRPIKKIMGKLAVEKKVKFYVRIFQLLVVFTIFLLLFWFIPAIIMVHTEDDWDYITAVYFCFITITTIGLGKFVPLSLLLKYEHHEN